MTATQSSAADDATSINMAIYIRRSKPSYNMMAIIHGVPCKQNKMELNYDKTACLIVGTQHRT